MPPKLEEIWEWDTWARFDADLSSYLAFLDESVGSLAYGATNHKELCDIEYSFVGLAGGAGFLPYVRVKVEPDPGLLKPKETRQSRLANALGPTPLFD
jgi:hypothetical protein